MENGLGVLTMVFLMSDGAETGAEGELLAGLQPSVYVTRPPPPTTSSSPLLSSRLKTNLPKSFPLLSEGMFTQNCASVLVFVQCLIYL